MNRVELFLRISFSSIIFLIVLLYFVVIDLCDSFIYSKLFGKMIVKAQKQLQKVDRYLSIMFKNLKPRKTICINI